MNDRASTDDGLSLPKLECELHSWPARGIRAARRLSNLLDAGRTRSWPWAGGGASDRRLRPRRNPLRAKGQPELATKAAARTSERRGFCLSPTRLVERTEFVGAAQSEKARLPSRPCRPSRGANGTFARASCSRGPSVEDDQLNRPKRPESQPIWEGYDRGRGRRELCLYRRRPCGGRNGGTAQRGCEASASSEVGR